MVKKLTLCKLLYRRKCKRREVDGQKKPNFVNVVCERPLIITNIQNFTLNLSFDMMWTKNVTA